MSRTRGWIPALVVAIGLLIPNLAAAQGTPTSEIALPLAPDPARCTVTPKPKAEIDELYAQVNPDGVELEPVGTPLPSVITEDQPVDASTQTAITELIVTVLACSANGNHGLADAALLTHEHLVENLREIARADYEVFYAENVEPSPPENWIILYGLHDFRTLPDSRVAVNPDVIVPGVGRFIDTLILKQVDGRWLIDYSQEGDGNLYGNDIPAQ